MLPKNLQLVSLKKKFLHSVELVSLVSSLENIGRGAVENAIIYLCNFVFLLYDCNYIIPAGSVWLAGGGCLEYYYNSKPSTPFLGTLSRSTSLLGGWHCWLPYATTGYLCSSLSVSASLGRSYCIKTHSNTHLHAYWTLVFSSAKMWYALE